MENEKWSYQVSQVSGSESGRRFYVFSDKNELITDKVKTEGQARLIAAAPDLLAALKDWAGFARENYSADPSAPNYVSFLQRTLAAIAKAEGETR